MSASPSKEGPESYDCEMALADLAPASTELNPGHQGQGDASNSHLRSVSDQPEENATLWRKMGNVSAAIFGFVCCPVVLTSIVECGHCHHHHHDESKSRRWRKIVIGAVAVAFITVVIVFGVGCSTGKLKCGHQKPKDPHVTAPPQAQGAPISTPSPLPTTTTGTNSPTASICPTTLGGSNASISNSANGLEWGVLAPVQIGSVVFTEAANLTAPSRFRIEFTGDPTNAYSFRAVDNSTLVVSTLNTPNITLALPNSLDSHQYFNITCDPCTTGGRNITGCVIAAWAGGTCVESEDPGEPLALATCDGQLHQKFDLFISVS